MRLIQLCGYGNGDILLVNADQICTMAHEYEESEPLKRSDHRFADGGVVRWNHTRLQMPHKCIEVMEAPEHVALLSHGWNRTDDRLRWLRAIEAEGGPTADETAALFCPDTTREVVDEILGCLAARCETWCETKSDAAREANAS